MRNVIWTSIVGLALVAFAQPASAQQTRTRTAYVSAVDKDGNPVTDLQAADLELKAGGKAQTIVSIKETTTPLRIAILDADQGTGAYQAGIGNFMQDLLERAEFSIRSVIVQPDKLTDYTQDGRILSEALAKIGQRGRQAGAQLLEAIDEAARTVNAEGKRPVILVARLGAEASTDLQSKDVMERIRKSRAALYVVSSAGAEGQGSTTDSVQQLAVVLSDGSRETGGRYEVVAATSTVPVFKKMASELLHQYEVAYEGADTLKPGDRLQISTKRKGVTVRTALRLPN